MIHILKAIPQHSPLKCLYVDTVFWENKDFEKLASFMEEKEFPVAILGLNMPDRLAVERLKKYHEVHFKNVEFTAKKVEFEYWKTSTGYETSNH